MQKSTSGNFKGFLAEYPRLKTHFKELLDSHYSNGIYASEKAREIYLEPDFLPFVDLWDKLFGKSCQSLRNYIFGRKVGNAKN